MRKILKALSIFQEHKNTKGNIKGRGYSYAYRLNPFNPLSYLLIPIMIIVGIILFGVLGVFKEVDHRNPFKWL